MKRLLLLGLLLVGCGGSGVPKFNLSAGSVSVLLGSFASSTVSLVPSTDFSGEVVLSFEAPAETALSGSFSPTSLSSSATSSRLTINAPANASPGTYQATIRGTNGAQSQTTTITVTVSGLGGGGGGGGNDGSIAGAVSISIPTPSDSDFVPGQMIVKYKSGVSVQNAQTLQVGGVRMQQVRVLSVERTSLYQAPLDARGTLQAVAELSARGDIEYAQPRYRYRIYRSPNDPLYVQQWHYPAMNLPQAWDIERGQTNPVTVAVIDTGQLLQHPDFDRNRILPGFDMISDPQNANDGDERDNNPDDPGDNPGGQASYHGTHVAGTILANSDNGAGVAGVSWGARLLPVRVLGAQGGDILDVTDGMLWAAGLTVDGVPSNPNKAAVINMSLGGRRPCSQDPFYQEVINRVNAAGVIIVVAAGNEAENAAGFSPASCSGVITVGATGPSGGRAPYSNYGTRIDVMAPGGNTSVNLGGVTQGGGILSTLKNDANGNFAFTFYQGTSMASPHAAGLVALLKSAKPSLTRAEVLDLLKRTARPLDLSKCRGETSPRLPTPPAGITAGDCGAGLVDALAAIQGTNTAPTGSFTLSTTPSSLTIAPGASAQVLVGLERVGGFSGAVNLSLQGAPAGVSGAFTPSSPIGISSTLALSVAPSVAAGQYPMTVQGTVSINGQTVSVSAALVLTVGVNNTPTVKDVFVGALFWTGTEYDLNRSKGITLTADTRTANYSIAGLVAGQYAVAGWKDINKNEEVDAGDYFGIYRAGGRLAYVRPNAININVNLELNVSTTRGDAQLLSLFKQMLGK